MAKKKNNWVVEDLDFDDGLETIYYEPKKQNKDIISTGLDLAGGLVQGGINTIGTIGGNLVESASHILKEPKAFVENGIDLSDPLGTAKNYFTTAFNTGIDAQVFLAKGFFGTLEGVADFLQYTSADNAHAFSEIGKKLIGDNPVSDLYGGYAKWLKGNAEFDSTAALVGQDPENSLFENLMWAKGNNLEKLNQNIKKTTGKDLGLDKPARVFTELGYLNDEGKTHAQVAQDYSILGSTGESIFEGIGNIGAMAAMSAVGGELAGAAGLTTSAGELSTLGKLASSGIPSYTSAYGNARTKAYKDGASDSDARKYATISGFAEAISEQFFDAMPGVKSANILGKRIPIKSAITDRLEKSFGSNVGKLFLKFAGGLEEGSEEIISNVLVTLGSELLMLDKNYQYNPDNLSGDVKQDIVDTFLSQESWDAFFSAGFTSALLGGGEIARDTATRNQIINAYAKDNNMSFKEAKQLLTGETLESTKQGMDRADYDTNVEFNEAAEKRILNYMEQHTGENIESRIEDLIKVEEQNKGIEYSEEDRAKLAEKIRKDLIDRTNNPDKYSSFRMDEASEEEKNSQLYKDFNRLANNTKESHKLYNFYKALKGRNENSVFELTNNEELVKEGYLEKKDGKYGRTIDGKFVEEIPNGINLGNKILINADGLNAFEATTWHEIAHSIKDSSPEGYNELKQIVKDYYGENDYQKYEQKYRDLYGDSDLLEDEYVNDKLGEMLNNEDFIERISGNQSLLQTLINKIKRTIKYMTSGKEQKRLMKLQDQLEKKYTELYGEAKFEGDESLPFYDGEDARYSLGKHYGDLGKGNDTYYFQMANSRRGTGHFGTGTYFVNEEYQPGESSSYANRPTQSVEFDDYNLFKPQSANDGFDLHDALKEVNYNNNPISQELYNELTPYYEASFRAYNELLSEEEESNYSKVRGLLEQAGIETEEYDGYNSLEYERDLEDKITDVLNDYDRYQGAKRDLERILGITDEQFDKSMQEVRDAKAKYDNTDEMDLLKSDSLSTIFMKSLGYNGIDVRGIDQLDNTTYGSVIYDLDNKKPKYSLSQDSQGRELSKEQQEFFKDSKVRDQDGRLLEVYHGTPNGEFFEFNKNYLGETSLAEDARLGFHFTDNKVLADYFSKDLTDDPDVDRPVVMSQYLNIKKPLSYFADYGISEEQLANDLVYISTGETDVTNVTDTYENNMEVLSALQQDFDNARAEMKDMLATPEAMERIRELGYDGLILPMASADSKTILQSGNEYIIFDSNQTKNTDNVNPTSSPDIRYSLSSGELSTQDKINQSMTMDEAREMLRRAFVLSDIEDYSDGAVTNIDEWVNNDDWNYQISMIIDSNQDLYNKYIASNEDMNNEEYTLDDIIEAYKNGTLTGKQQQTLGRVDTSLDTGFTDNRFYSPQQIEYGKENYDIANQRVTKNNEQEVYRARANFITAAHQEGFAESLGLTQDEVNKKLKSWANYPKKAMELSQSLNEGVAKQNQWTGLENSSIVNEISITDEEMESMVKQVIGKENGNGWKRKYITSTMLALDTHIDYKNLTFDFEQTKDLNEKHAAGDYDHRTDTIRIGDGYQNTVAHEIGHYIDYQWARDLVGNDSQTLSSLSRNYDPGKLSQEQVQFIEHFREFQNSIEETAEIGDTLKYSSKRDASYWQTPTETFARFVGKFTEWVTNQATNNRYGYEEKFYTDKFTESQYKEFVKILQEKSALDTTLEQKYGTYNQQIIDLMDSITDEQREQLRQAYAELDNDQTPAYQLTERIQDIVGKDIYYKLNGQQLREIANSQQYSLSQEPSQRTTGTYSEDIAIPTIDYNLPTQEVAVETQNVPVNERTTTEDRLAEQRRKLADKRIKTMIEKQTYKSVKQATKIAKDYLGFDSKETQQFREGIEDLARKRKDNLIKAENYQEVKDLVGQYANRDMTFVSEELKEAQKDVRHTQLIVSDDLKDQITDWTDFRKKSGLNIKKGQKSNVDVVYQEFCDMYPGMFDDTITNYADQLQAMSEFVHKDNKFVETYTLSDETLNQITNRVWEKLSQNALTKQDFKDIEDTINKQAERRTREVVRNALLDEMGITLDDIDVGKDITSIAYQRTDPKRLNEKVFGYDIGQKVNDATVNFVGHQEAERTRFLNNERNDIEELGIKARSKESAAVQKYGEKQYVNDKGELVEYNDRDLMSEFPRFEDQQKIKNAAKALRAKYDEYIDLANDKLVEMGYDPIPKRQDYFKHFTELQDKFSQWGIPFSRENLTSEELSTDINGLTDQFKPGKNFFASAMERKGIKTTYDAITGIDSYLEGISNLIYHTESIQRYRALSKMIRDTYGQTHGLENLDTMTEEEAAKRVEDVYNNKLTRYAAWLDEQANSLAGKKGAIDRSMERFMGRKAYTFLNALKSQVGSNMTGFNVRSAMTNFASAIQGASKTQKISFLEGTAFAVKNYLNEDSDLINKSDFLTRRFGSDALSQKTWQKISAAGQVFMSATDRFTSLQIWGGKYYEGLNSGLTQEAAIKQADDFAARIMGDRSKGQTAEIFNSKTLGLLTQFQLEVNNQWSSMMHDNKMEMQKNPGLKTSMKIVGQLGQLYAFSYMFNGLMKALTGSDVMFDPIDILKGIIAPDDEDEEKTLEERATEAIGKIIDQLPMASIFTGGRIPISEAFTGVGTLAKKLTGQKDNYGNEYTWDDVKDDLIASAFYYLLPTGYGQIKKTAQGLGQYGQILPEPIERAMDIYHNENLPIAGNYTKAGKLKYEADTSTFGKIQSGLFGRNASANAVEYREMGYSPLSEKKAQEAYDANLPISEYRRIDKGIKDAAAEAKENNESQSNAKAEYIYNLPLKTDQKNILVNGALNRKNPIDMTDYGKYGSLEEFDYANKNPEKYLTLTQIADYDSYQEYEDVIQKLKKAYTDKNARKRAIHEYIDSLNLNMYQKLMLENQAAGYSIKNYKSQVRSYIDSLNLSAQDKQKIDKELFGGK